MIRSSNPVLNQSSFQNEGIALPAGEAMTIDGTVNKCLITLGLVVVPAFWTYQNPMLLLPYWIGALIGALVIALVITFKKTWAPILTPAYAICEGLILGAISAMYDTRYPGIVFQAISITFLTCFSLLYAYRSGWIQVTEKFRLGITAAVMGIALYYILSLVLGLFGFNGLNRAYASNSLFSIGLSVFIAGVAALSLLLDFDFIEKAAKSGRQPKYMEWYGAFGLLVTLVWLYLEILRLLSKFKDRR